MKGLLAVVIIVIFGTFVSYFGSGIKKAPRTNKGGIVFVNKKGKRLK